MPLENDLDKVLIIGSGPTLVGKVSETDLLVEDAIQALSEEDIQVVLVNPNPATISTDKKSGLTVYLEPMTLEFLKRIIRMEEPSAIISAYGSTTGLKVTRELVQDGILQKMGVRLLTLNKQTLTMDNHQKMNTFLAENQIEANKYWNLTDFSAVDIQKQLSEKVQFPVMLIKENTSAKNTQIIFDNVSDLNEYLTKERQSESFSFGNYHLSEDLSSWEEVIANIIRDSSGNILFTNLADTVESVAINAGDSATVMPALTLNNDQVQKIRAIAKVIANKLKIVGILNIHFAVKHEGTKFSVKILSIKPRLTRSAIWSKRVGLYSLGYIVCKVAIGYRLDEITDPLSGLNAAVEPTLDKVAVRMPFWSLTQSGSNHYLLGAKMQASGEAIGIGTNFESAFLKGLASTVNLKISLKIFKTEKALQNTR